MQLAATGLPACRAPARFGHIASARWLESFLGSALAAATLVAMLAFHKLQRNELAGLPRLLGP
jgi:hypothetical protein